MIQSSSMVVYIIRHVGKGLCMIQSSSMVVYIIRHVGKWWCMIQSSSMVVYIIRHVGKWWCMIQSSSMIVYIIRHVGKWWCMIQRTCILIKCLIDKWVMYGLPNYDDETIDEDMIVRVFYYLYAHNIRTVIEYSVVGRV